jgi:hypothetical protein
LVNADGGVGLFEELLAAINEAYADERRRWMNDAGADERRRWRNGAGAVEVRGILTENGSLRLAELRETEAVLKQ